MFASSIVVPTWVIPGILVGIGGFVLSRIFRSVINSMQDWARQWFETLLKEVKPNGGNTNSLGDTAKRTEQIFSAHAELDQAIQKKQNKNIKELRKEVQQIAAMVGVVERRRLDHPEPGKTQA